MIILRDRITFNSQLECHKEVNAKVYSMSKWGVNIIEMEKRHLKANNKHELFSSLVGDSKVDCLYLRLMLFISRHQTKTLGLQLCGKVEGLVSVNVEAMEAEEVMERKRNILCHIII